MRLVQWVIFVVAACGGGSGGILLSAAPDDLHRALCDWLARCGEVPDTASCISDKTGLEGVTFRIDPNEQAAVEVGKIKYDGGKMATCISSYENRSCDETSQSFRDLFSRNECMGIFTGTVAAGGECAQNGECISNVCNVPACSMACCTGICVGGTPPAGPAAIGQPCNTTSTTSCVSGAFCNVSGLCAAQETEGTPCSGDDECAYGLACAVFTTMTCKPLPALGEACPDQRCRDLGTACENGTCTTLPTLGGACMTSFIRSCQVIYTCNGTTCVARQPIGAACTSNFDCADYTAFCGNAGTCELPQAEGASCVSDQQCQSQLCDPTTSLCAAAVTCI